MRRPKHDSETEHRRHVNPETMLDIEAERRCVHACLVPLTCSLCPCWCCALPIMRRRYKEFHFIQVCATQALGAHANASRLPAVQEPGTEALDWFRGCLCPVCVVNQMFWDSYQRRRCRNRRLFRAAELASTDLEADHSGNILGGNTAPQHQKMTR
jgi:hypothetical protein